MARHRHLNRAPLVEALLDIRVTPPEGLAIESLLEFEKALVATGYRRKGEKRQAGFMMKIVGSEMEPMKGGASNLIGYALIDATEKRVVQVTLNSFTQNLLAPYTQFEDLVDEAKRNWAEFLKVVRPTKITRLALRYINRLQLPIAPGSRFEDFLPYAPQVPPELPQGVSDFNSRATIVDERRQAHVIVNQIFQGSPPTSDGVAVILDIDAIMDDQFDVDDPKLWGYFDTLRELKNEAFFSYVTDALLGRYE